MFCQCTLKIGNMVLNRGEEGLKAEFVTNTGILERLSDPRKAFWKCARQQPFLDDSRAEIYYQYIREEVRTTGTVCAFRGLKHASFLKSEC